MNNNIPAEQKSALVTVLVFGQSGLENLISFFQKATDEEVKGVKKIRSAVRTLVEPLFSGNDIEAVEPVIQEACRKISENMAKNPEYRLSRWTFKHILGWLRENQEDLSEKTAVSVKDMILAIAKSRPEFLDEKVKEAVLEALESVAELVDAEINQKFCADLKVALEDVDRNELVEQILGHCEDVLTSAMNA